MSCGQRHSQSFCTELSFQENLRCEYLWRKEIVFACKQRVGLFIAWQDKDIVSLQRKAQHKMPVLCWCGASLQQSWYPPGLSPALLEFEHQAEETEHKTCAGCPTVSFSGSRKMSSSVCSRGVGEMSQWSGVPVWLPELWWQLKTI